MLNQGPGKSQWFNSYEHKVWFFGTLSSPRLVYLSFDGHQPSRELYLRIGSSPHSSRGKERHRARNSLRLYTRGPKLNYSCLV